MKKLSENELLLIAESTETIRLEESNAYLDFSKKFFKEEGVSGPFDAKAPKDLMKKLSAAWKKHKGEDDSKETVKEDK